MKKSAKPALQRSVVGSLSLGFGLGMPRIILFCIGCLVLGGCKATVAPNSFVGVATNRADWPYRYRISPTAVGWSGIVDARVEGGWVPWDTMKITKQKNGDVYFSALIGVPGKALPIMWHLSLDPVDADGFRGKLTIEVLEKRSDNVDTTPIEIEFKRSAEADGAAIGATNRTSPTAASRR